MRKVGTRDVGRIAVELFKVKQQLDKAKILYAKYDDLLEQLIHQTKQPVKVNDGGDIFILSIVDNFTKKNTAWKSVAIRQYDVEVLKVK